MSKQPPMVSGILPGLAFVKHRPEEVGFCSLRTITFDTEGDVTVTEIDLEAHQAQRLCYALRDALAYRGDDRE